MMVRASRTADGLTFESVLSARLDGMALMQRMDDAPLISRLPAARCRAV